MKIILADEVQVDSLYSAADFTSSVQIPLVEIFLPWRLTLHTKMFFLKITVLIEGSNECAIEVD